MTRIGIVGLGFTCMNPSLFRAPGGRGEVKARDTRNLPVDSVSWDKATAFCRKLSHRRNEKRCGRKYRLPTEAEWEFACRGGGSSSTAFYFGETLSAAHTAFSRTYDEGTAAVGSYPP